LDRKGERDMEKNRVISEHDVTTYNIEVTKKYSTPTSTKYSDVTHFDSDGGFLF
jgi:hypothetical protein